MHINALFVCSLVPGARYFHTDSSRSFVELPFYLATTSLLPIALDASKSVKSGTWWSFSQTENSFAREFADARARGVRTVIMPAAFFPLAQAAQGVGEGECELVLIPDNMTAALFTVTRAWRAQCLVPIVAIAGSIGKTTSIDMISAIAGVDNLPLYVHAESEVTLEELAIAVLHVTDKYVAALFEVGFTRGQDIFAAADILRPTLALITAVCAASQQEAQSAELLASAKQQIFSFFSPSQIGIVCGDYSELVSYSYAHPVVRFGLKNKNVITARKVSTFKDQDGFLKTRMLLRMYDYEKEVVLSGCHKGLVYAALAASAIAYFLYVPFESIAKGIAAFISLPRGFHQCFLKEGRGVLMHDVHSISPDSAKAALHAAHAFGKRQRKIAVLGSIPHLGERSVFWHRQVGRELMKTRSISDVILVGDSSKSMRTTVPTTMNVLIAADWHEAQERVRSILAPSDNVLLLSGAAPSPIKNMVTQLI